MLRFKSLASGSSGNATLIECSSGTRTTRMLVDCGLKLKTLQARLAEAGTDLDHLDAIFITHEHGDHIGCVRHVLKYRQLPVWMSQGTYLAVHDAQWETFRPWIHLTRDGDTIELGELKAAPFTVPHDAREPLQLRVSDGNRRMGLVTDLGHVTPHVVNALANCHALLLEANHDPGLLQNSRYPEFLKVRVGGAWRHLSNQAAADLLSQVAHSDLQRVVAAHLSERNNTPALAQQHLSAVLGCAPRDIDVADPVYGTDWIEA